MDELECKIIAHEMALIETVAHIDADHIREGVRATRAGLVVGITEEERTIRIAAIELLEAAFQRFGRPRLISWAICPLRSNWRSGSPGAPVASLAPTEVVSQFAIFGP